MAQSKNLRSSSSRPSGSASSAHIGSVAKIRGRITGEGDLTVEGRVEGDITLRGDLTIAGGGFVVSQVDAESVTVGGTLEGNVHATGPVRFTSGCRFEGDVRGESVSIEEGSQFTGRVDCEFTLPDELSERAAPRR